MGVYPGSCVWIMTKQFVHLWGARTMVRLIQLRSDAGLCSLCMGLLTHDSSPALLLLWWSMHSPVTDPCAVVVYPSTSMALVQLHVYCVCDQAAPIHFGPVCILYMHARLCRCVYMASCVAKTRQGPCSVPRCTGHAMVAACVGGVHAGAIVRGCVAAQLNWMQPALSVVTTLLSLAEQSSASSGLRLAQGICLVCTCLQARPVLYVLDAFCTQYWDKMRARCKARACLRHACALYLLVVAGLMALFLLPLC